MSLHIIIGTIYLIIYYKPAFDCVDETSTPAINTVIYYVKIIEDASGVKQYQFSKIIRHRGCLRPH